MKGIILTNTKQHATYGNRSSAKGFCFSADPPKEAWKYLKGIVDFDVCMVLDIPRAYLTQAFARYRDVRHLNGESVVKMEYCAQSYSRYSAKLLRALKPEEFATEQEIKIAKYVKEYLSLLSHSNKSPITIEALFNDGN